jgi:YHS domain-containing protein
MNKVIFAVILMGLIAFGIKSNANSKIDKQRSVVADSVQKKVVDPVCKMKIKPAGAKTTTYNKITYLFCSESCKQKFIAEPVKYVKK